MLIIPKDFRSTKRILFEYLWSLCCFSTSIFYFADQSTLSVGNFFLWIWMTTAINSFIDLVVNLRQIALHEIDYPPLPFSRFPYAERRRQIFKHYSELCLVLIVIWLVVNAICLFISCVPLVKFDFLTDRSGLIDDYELFFLPAIISGINQFQFSQNKPISHRGPFSWVVYPARFIVLGSLLCGYFLINHSKQASSSLILLTNLIIFFPVDIYLISRLFQWLGVKGMSESRH